MARGSWLLRATRTCLCPRPRCTDTYNSFQPGTYFPGGVLCGMEQGGEIEKFTDMHLNNFLSDFPMSCQQLLNITLPLLADDVAAAALKNRVIAASPLSWRLALADPQAPFLVLGKNGFLQWAAGWQQGASSNHAQPPTAALSPAEGGAAGSSHRACRILLRN